MLHFCYKRPLVFWGRLFYICFMIKQGDLFAEFSRDARGLEVHVFVREQFDPRDKRGTLVCATCGAVAMSKEGREPCRKGP